MARSLVALAVTSLAISLLTACDAGPGPRLEVSPNPAFYAMPFTATVDTLMPGSLVTFHLTMRSSNGGRWTSAATYRADARGVVSTNQAPRSGDYRGSRRMGLVDALRPTAGSPDAFTLATLDEPTTMDLTASVGGDTIGHVTLRRSFCNAVAATRSFTVATDGVDGVLAQPLHPTAQRQPGVLIIGGSQGGYAGAALACQLAWQGYPSLEIAYFNAPGLPPTAARLPLEYFQHAAQLLAHQPNVDARRIVLWGISLGSQAALLTAAHFPGTAYAVVATTPFATVTGGAPDTSQPLWTLHGRALQPAPNPEALPAPTSTGAIPVERIHGPILLACGEQDQVINSCANAHAIQQRLALEHSSPATLLDYPNAGHSLNTFGVYIPVGTTISSIGGIQDASGGTLLDDAEARENGWDHLLHWLSALREQ